MLLKAERQGKKFNRIAEQSAGGDGEEDGEGGCEGVRVGVIVGRVGIVLLTKSEHCIETGTPHVSARDNVGNWMLVRFVQTQQPRKLISCLSDCRQFMSHEIGLSEQAAIVALPSCTLRRRRDNGIQN